MLKHPNRLPFWGVLTRVGLPSDVAPSGARGHRVILTRRAAQAALASLRGMAVDYTPEWDGHDTRRKFGVITSAQIRGSRLLVQGHVFARDFPDIVRDLRHRFVPGEMGMSYEVADAHVEDMRAQFWTITNLTFTGAAILFRHKAAYKTTSFQLRSHDATEPAHPADVRNQAVIALKTTARDEAAPLDTVAARRIDPSRAALSVAAHDQTVQDEPPQD